MQRIVDTVKIISCANDISNYLNELNNEKKTLVSDIESIESVYNGIDSEIIISKYLEKTDYINEIANKYAIIGNYIKKVGEAYYNNLNETKKNLGKIVGSTTSSNMIIQPVTDEDSPVNNLVDSEDKNNNTQYLEAVVTTSGGKLKVRSSASSSSSVLTKLKNKSKIKVVEQGEKWTKISYTTSSGKEKFGYVSNDYIKINSTDTSSAINNINTNLSSDINTITKVANTKTTTNSSNVSYKTGVVTTNGGKLNVRSSASTSSKVLGTLKNNAQIRVVEKGKQWSKIVAFDSKGNAKYGYVASKYISTK